MEKYKFENNKAVVDLPCIITISKSSVSIEHASNTDSADIPDAGLTILVGNIESYNPTSLSPEPEPEITPTPSEGGSEGGSEGSGESGGGSGSQEGGSEQGGGSGGDAPVTPDPTPSGNYITLEIKNNLGMLARLNGRVVLNVGHNANTWDGSTQVEANLHSKINEWHQNDIFINSGETKSWNVQIESFLPGSPDHATATNGTWHILGVQNSVNLSNPVYLYSAMEYGNGAPNDSSHTRGVAHSSSSMYIAGIPNSTLILNGNKYHMEINLTALDVLGNTMTIKPDMTGYYVVL